MNPFNDHIDEYTRQLYGKYRMRSSAQKHGDYCNTWSVTMNGTSWVDMPLSTCGIPPRFSNISVYTIAFTCSAGWVGTQMYRILINGQKVYPFADDEDCQVHTGHHGFRCWSIPVKLGEYFLIQGRSTNAADTTVTLHGFVKLIRWKQGLGY